MRLITTEDNSPSIYSEEYQQSYHSTHGAVSESLHVFIEYGLKNFISSDKVDIFEMGYGTGINALLTYNFAIENKLNIHYTSLEKYPVSESIYETIAFENSLWTERLQRLNRLSWNEQHELDGFSLEKIEVDIRDYSIGSSKYDLIYFDAFSPNAQPELWTEDIFSKIYASMKPNAILTTYCAKGVVKRTLKSCGYELHVQPGPKGKREMIQAIKK